MSQTKYSPGDVVYEAGQSSDVMYFIKQGSIMMESVIEIDHINRLPIGKHSSEQITTKFKVGYQVKKFVSGQIFGHQEIIEQGLQKQRELEFPFAVK